MNWFESILYGIVCGITEFLPISSLAHKKILLKLFGQVTDPLQDLIVHLALLASVLVGCRNLIDQLRRSRHLRSNNRRGIRGNNSVHEVRFLKNSAIAMLIAYFALLKCVPIGENLLFIALFSLVNTVILFVASRMMQGNKDERSVSILDSFVVGLAGSLSVFSGISRIAAMLAAATFRGIEKRKAVNWVLLLSIPALLLLVALDIFYLFTAAMHVTGNFWTYLLSGISAYIAGYFGVIFMRSASNNNDHSGYAIYAFGVMLFSLFLYLSVV